MLTQSYQKKQHQSVENNHNYYQIRQEKKSHLLRKMTLKIKFKILCNCQKSKRKMIKIYQQIQIIVLNRLKYQVSFQSGKLIKNSIQIWTHRHRVMRCSILIKILITRKNQIKYNQVNQKLYMKTLKRMKDQQ